MSSPFLELAVTGLRPAAHEHSSRFVKNVLKFTLPFQAWSNPNGRITLIARICHLIVTVGKWADDALGFKFSFLGFRRRDVDLRLGFN
jgi:hypothetical protein